MNNISIQNDERGLLPYPIIIAANAGEAEATLRHVVKHCDSYITSLSMRKLRDEQESIELFLSIKLQYFFHNESSLHIVTERKINRINLVKLIFFIERNSTFIFFPYSEPYICFI